jgi:hypothetical protein
MLQSADAGPETKTEISLARTEGVGELGNVGLDIGDSAAFHPAASRIQTLPVRIEAVLDASTLRV